MTIESAIRQLNGVEDATVSFTTETLEVGGDIELDAIEARLNELGYRITTADSVRPNLELEQRGLIGFLYFLWERPSYRSAVLVSAMAIVGMLVLPIAGIETIAGYSAVSLLFIAGLLIVAAPIFLRGFRSLLFGRRITIDLLMAIAAIGAIAIGETGEAITVILLFTLGEALEGYSAERARDSLRTLLLLQPEEATVLESHHASHIHGQSDFCGEGGGDHDHQVVKPVDQVKVGDRVLVRPGQRIPIDGEIVNGVSSVNQAPVTGENVPILREIGDEVMAGSVNGEAALEVRVSRPSSEGTIARIAKLVEQAQAQRSPAERFVDRFARYYTPAVVVLAVLVVTIPVLALGQPLLDAPDGTRGWMYRGLTMLIIACPCALVISIPVTVVSGLTRLAQLGVLVKSGALLDRLADITVIGFDKTGTLTHGRPIVSGMGTPNCEHPADAYSTCDPCETVIGQAASVERASEHPVAHAIVAAAGDDGRHVDLATGVIAYPGKGVSGTADCGHRIAVGSHRLFEENQDGWKEVNRAASGAEKRGETVMYVSHDHKVVGYIGVRDQIREVTASVLAELGEMRPPIRRVMLTGDHLQVARRVASEIAGIDSVHAGLLPDQKLAAIDELTQDGSAVAMVGDGINDAPALARADIGIAMGGGGTAQAMETADVVLMQDDLSRLPMALRIARKSRRVIKENIVLSLGLKLAFLALAIPGIATLWMAVVADVGATLLVTLNGMRMLREK